MNRNGSTSSAGKFLVVACLGLFALLAVADKHTPIKKAKPRAQSVGREEILDMQTALRVFGDKENAPRETHKRGSHGEWGLFQFKRPRWVESGGRAGEWGKASASRQTAIMEQAIVNYLSRMSDVWRATLEDRLIWIANFHNMGHGSLKRTAYAIDFVDRYMAYLRE